MTRAEWRHSRDKDQRGHIKRLRGAELKVEVLKGKRRSRGSRMEEALEELAWGNLVQPNNL